MSPEQLRYQEADRRSDLFSLGIIIYEMVSGERLYKNRDGHDGIRRILEEPPPDIGEVRPEVPATLTALIFRLLAKDPESRIETAAAAGLQLEEVLKEILESEPPLELPPLLEEITGSFREERKQAMSALIAKAERESQGGQRILKIAETPVVDVVASRGTRPWLYAGAISLAVAIGVSAWALGRMGAGANTEVVDSPPAEPRDESVVDEVVSEDPLSDDDVATHVRYRRRGSRRHDDDEPSRAAGDPSTNARASKSDDRSDGNRRRDGNPGLALGRVGVTKPL
jgi:serine/threonine-protein kinase